MVNSNTYAKALAIFEQTLKAEGGVSTAINFGLLKMADQEVIERVSAQVQGAVLSGERVWMTSDLHFCHHNIIGFSDRPFHGLKDMTDAHLLLLGKVPADDILIFAGDMALGDYDLAVAYIRSIPCRRKILVAGNHDFTRDGVCKLAREKDLFEAVVPFLFWEGYKSRLVMVTHYPVHVTIHDSSRSVVNYHGHLHVKTLEPTPMCKWINVGWDVTHSLLCL
jgi:calcineurin-like phosphoesterase family protein